MAEFMHVEFTKYSMWEFKIDNLENATQVVTLPQLFWNQ